VAKTQYSKCGHVVAAVMTKVKKRSSCISQLVSRCNGSGIGQVLRYHSWMKRSCINGVKMHKKIWLIEVLLPIIITLGVAYFVFPWIFSLFIHLPPIPQIGATGLIGSFIIIPTGMSIISICMDFTTAMHEDIKLKQRDQTRHKDWVDKQWDEYEN